MAEIWDAIVVGAGPAGCAAAFDLAAAGRRVLLVDKAVFPRPKACAGGLTIKAVRALRYSIAPVVRTWQNRIVLEERAGSSVDVGRTRPVCAMTVREELDAFCLEQTRARGVEFRQVSALTAVAEEADRVVLHLAGAEPLTARFLIGADGVHSRVRALTTGARWFRTGFAVEANVPHAYAKEQFPLLFDFAAAPRGYGWLFPRDNHVNVGLYMESAAGDAAAHVNRSALLRYIELRCGEGRTITRPVGQFLGLGAARYEPAPRTRVLLAGDAAGFVDPLTGEGIYGAIRSGQAVAAAVQHGLGRVKTAGRRVEVSKPDGPSAGTAFVAASRTLRADLAVAEHAAHRFFAEPARGFRLMRLPLVPRAVLQAYAEGLSLGMLLRGVRFAAALAGRSGPAG
ncbi:NAD(P)/FAD-dependent oxidoreductase [Acidipila sp. EB88]|uniref:NAD(P)/FAD-dependent oxidoreductase n=1 Tax=Acidipila sp. EB88 TaxID=2305226 RepID=UPI000F5EE681|nr:geranylgeranyl reductase family protein [Acidipila sp. EB88]RRA48001.1 geranylgeranyl reductase family protein [Acidipila sp. EB88]